MSAKTNPNPSSRASSFQRNIPKNPGLVPGAARQNSCPEITGVMKYDTNPNIAILKGKSFQVTIRLHSLNPPKMGQTNNDPRLIRLMFHDDFVKIGPGLLCQSYTVRKETQQTSQEGTRQHKNLHPKPTSCRVAHIHYTCVYKYI